MHVRIDGGETIILSLISSRLVAVSRGSLTIDRIEREYSTL